MNFERSNKFNRYSLYDVGSAVTNLTMQATAMDLYVHQMAGFDSEKAQQLFKIPEGYKPVSAIAIGYYGNIENLPDDVLIYHLKMRNLPEDELIPGIAKDYIDFKAAFAKDKE